MSTVPGRAVPPPDAHAKALAINLDGTIYGTFAEIGAGQEVARWFLTVGAASGTVAKTISAYDKTVSDAVYGSGTRYVSRERLIAMLDHEYPLVVERLGTVRGAKTKFFAFADTASARNYQGDNDQHAWIGIRFQAEPGGEPNDVILHVNLLDPTNARQQEALGIIGVNLIHAVHHHRKSIEDFLSALWDELSLERMEVDVIELTGPALAHIDCSRCGLGLLRGGLARAIVFNTNGRVVEPSAVLRKHPLIINRGKFAPFIPLYAQMLTSGEKMLREEGVPLGREPVRVFEMSLRPLGEPGPSDDETLERITPLLPHGAVIVSAFGELYLIADYLRRHTAEPVRFAMGVSLFARILEDRFYDALPGRLLEGMGRFLAENAKLYVYPMPREALYADLRSAEERSWIAAGTHGEVTADDIRPKPPVEHLYRYMREGGWVIPARIG